MPAPHRHSSLLMDMTRALQKVVQVTGGSQHWQGDTKEMLLQVELVLEQIRNRYPSLMKDTRRHG